MLKPQETPLRKWLISLLFLATPVWAQTVSLQHSTLFTSSTACSTGGTGAVFGGTWADNARALSSIFNCTITDRSGNVFPIDHARLELTTTKADDDSLIVLLQGWSGGDSSATYLDTIYIPATAGVTTYANLSPSMTSSVLQFPSSGKLSVANEDSGANGAFPYFGLVADTNIWTMKLVIWTTQTETFTGAIVTFDGYQQDNDTLTWDATKADIQDTSTTLVWPDTLARLVTVSDTTVLRGQFALKVNYTDTTGMSNRILARADSSTTLYWADTLAKLITVSDTTILSARISAGGSDGQNADSIMGKAISIIPPTDNYILKWDLAGDSIMWEADGGTGLNWSDTTNVLITVSDTTVLRSQIYGRADSAATINWPDTTDRVLTVSDSTVLRGQFATKINYSDTSNYWMSPDTLATLVTVSDTTVLRGQFATKVNYADTANYWMLPDTLSILTTISDTTVLRGQFAAKMNYTDTTGLSNRILARTDSSASINWPDTTDRVLTVSDSTVLRGQFATKLNISDTTNTIVTVSDTTVLRGQFASKVNYTDTTGMSNRILARTDSSLSINWPDTTARILTVSDSTVLSGQFAFKVNYTDTTGMSNRILARTDSSASINWPDTTARIVTVSDTTVLSGQFALKVNYTDTTGMSNRILARTDSSASINWPDTTDRIITVSDTTVLSGGRQPVEATLTDFTDGNLAEAMIFTGDLAIPLHDGGAADAVREIDYDDGKAALYGFGAARGQLAAINKQFNFAIDNPLHLTHDSTFIWTNRTGSTVTIDSVYSIARQDDYDYDLVESSVSGGTVTLIESITVSTNGTGWFTNTVTAIDHAAIETGKGILFVQSADSTDCITGTVYYRITD